MQSYKRANGIQWSCPLCPLCMETAGSSVGETEGKNQTLVGAIPFCSEYPGPRFEDKFRSANQIDGISTADGGKMADS